MGKKSYSTEFSAAVAGLMQYFAANRDMMLFVRTYAGSESLRSQYTVGRADSDVNGFRIEEDIGKELLSLKSKFVKVGVTYLNWIAPGETPQPELATVYYPITHGLF